MAEEDRDPKRTTEDETLNGQDDDYAPSSFFDEAMYGREVEELLSTVPESAFYGSKSNDNPDLSQSVQHAQSAKPDQAAQDEEKAIIKRQEERMDAHQMRTAITNAYLGKNPEKPEKPELAVDDNGEATVQTGTSRGEEGQPEQQQEQQPAPKQNARAPSPLPQGPLIARGPKKRDSARKAEQEQQEESELTLTWKTSLSPGSRGPKKAKMD